MVLGGQALSNVVAIAAHNYYNLALKADGTVVGWGTNLFGQTNIPAGLNNVVAVAAGPYHSLALKADGTVVGWGDNDSRADQHSCQLRTMWWRLRRANPQSGAQGRWHRRRLGRQQLGETTVFLLPIYCGRPGDLSGQPLSNVAAIAAGDYHSLALKADGTVVGWGDNTYGQINIPVGSEQRRGGCCRLRPSLFLTATGISGTAANEGASFVRAQIPARVRPCSRAATRTRLMNWAWAVLWTPPPAQLSGAKALLADVLELGMPYTLAHDDVLHGFLYGSESLMDTSAATNFLRPKMLCSKPRPTRRPRRWQEWARLRYQRFQDRLNQCLTNLQATGQPEIPRLVGHTLRLLNLLRDAWTRQPTRRLRRWRCGAQSNSPCLLLYGEPYMRYTLQYRDTLSVPGWTTTTITNLQDEQTITPPFSATPATLLPSHAADAVRYPPNRSRNAPAWHARPHVAPSPAPG